MVHGVSVQWEDGGYLPTNGRREAYREGVYPPPYPGRYIRRFILLQDPSGRHIRRFIPLPGPLREAYMRGLYPSRTSQGGINQGIYTSQDPSGRHKPGYILLSGPLWVGINLPFNLPGWA